MNVSQFVLRNLIRDVVRFFAIAIVCTTVAGLAIFVIETREFKSKGKTIAKSIAQAAVDPLIDRDGATVQSIINRYLDSTGVGYVVILDQDGVEIAHTFVPRVPPLYKQYLLESYTQIELIAIKDIQLGELGEFIDISKPILGGVAGYVHVGMSKSVIFYDARTWILRLLAAVFVVFILSLIFSFWNAQSISEPLMELTNYVSRVARLDFSVEDPDIQTGDELQTLAEGMKTMKGELKQSVSELQQTLSDILAIENMDDGLLITDTLGVITRTNPRVGEMLDRPAEELMGLNLDEVLQSSLVEQLARTPLSSDQGVNEEVALPHKGVAKAVGKPILRASHLHPQKSTIIGYVICLRDITEEKELDAMKTSFIGTVSHELRTPLTSVLGFANLVERSLKKGIAPVLQEDQTKAWKAMDRALANLKIIRDEGERLTQIINDLLDVMKIESGEMEWDMNFIDLGKVLDRAILSTSSLFAETHIELVREPSERVPLVVGDHDRMIQVAINLISNAHKFTEEGRVTCRVVAEGENVILSISDTGRGISREDQEKVFQRFRQVGNQMTDKPAGSGLGLAICKEIVDSHSGTMRVTSEVGKGSTFSVVIPAAKPPYILQGLGNNQEASQQTSGKERMGA